MNRDISPIGSHIINIDSVILKKSQWKYFKEVAIAEIMIYIFF